MLEAGPLLHIKAHAAWQIIRVGEHSVHNLIPTLWLDGSQNLRVVVDEHYSDLKLVAAMCTNKLAARLYSFKVVLIMVCPI